MIYPSDFNPGPAQLYFTIADHMRTAFREGIPALSNRSSEFEKIFEGTSTALRNLLELPANYHILYTNSIAEVMSSFPGGLASTGSVVYTQGNDSNTLFTLAESFGLSPTKISAADGIFFSRDDFAARPTLPGMILLTHTETSTGAGWNPDAIRNLRKGYPGSVIAVQASSSLPYAQINYPDFDSIFFPVHHAFGLPPGLVVWMVNDRVLSKARDLTASTSPSRLLTLASHAEHHQTPEPISTLHLYLLGRVIEDFMRRGLKMIRSETDYKAAIFYGALENHPTLKPLVDNPEYRAKTLIGVKASKYTRDLVYLLQKNGINPGIGSDEALVFGNYPAHSKEQVERLVDLLNAFPG